MWAIAGWSGGLRPCTASLPWLGNSPMEPQDERGWGNMRLTENTTFPAVCAQPSSRSIKNKPHHPGVLVWRGHVPGRPVVQQPRLALGPLRNPTWWGEPQALGFEEGWPPWNLEMFPCLPKGKEGPGVFDANSTKRQPMDCRGQEACGSQGNPGSRAQSRPRRQIAPALR